MKENYREKDIVIYNNDNLDVLKNMNDRSVNLIYCDILYNTGKRFDDYNDNLGSPMEAIDWYRPRIIEMKRVLTDNGSIFIHCNWRLDSYMRILMDEIFGGECFRNRIYRQHSKERGFYSNFDSQIDIILYYVKNPEDFVYNEILNDEPKLVALFENGYVESKSKDIIYKNKIIDLSSQNKHLIITEAQFNYMAEKDEIIIIEGLPYRFSNVKPVGNLWNEESMLDTYKRTIIANAYDTPKPEAILERIITMCSNKGDVVADFFMGGGTTLVVAKKLGRKGIFCDISTKACDVAMFKLKSMNDKKLNNY